MQAVKRTLSFALTTIKKEEEKKTMNENRKKEKYLPPNSHTSPSQGVLPSIPGIVPGSETEIMPSNVTSA